MSLANVGSTHLSNSCYIYQGQNTAKIIPDVDDKTQLPTHHDL